MAWKVRLAEGSTKECWLQWPARRQISHSTVPSLLITMFEQAATIEQHAKAMTELDNERRQVGTVMWTMLCDCFPSLFPKR
jgi:hypothetical protein